MEKKTYKPIKGNYQFKILLGKTKRERYGSVKPIYLNGFRWDCDWYWSGGYIGNKDLHCHFNDAFLNVPDTRGHLLGTFKDPWTKVDNPERYSVLRNGASVWEDLTFFLDECPSHLAKN